jgi:hypothetical protein
MDFGGGEKILDWKRNCCGAFMTVGAEERREALFFEF